MDNVTAESFLLDQIPRRDRALFPATLRNAYAAADMVIKNEPILQVASAADNRGRIISWSVDLAFQKLIESGQWPVDFRWELFAKPTGRYLENRLSHSVLTISQVSDPFKQPRDVVFRPNDHLSNQRYLPLAEFADEEKENGDPAFLLVHGHRDLTFAHLGVPNKVHSMCYIYQTPNLLLMPHAVDSDLPPTEQTDVEATMTLKEEIEKWRKDNGE